MPWWKTSVVSSPPSVTVSGAESWISVIGVSSLWIGARPVVVVELEA